MSHALRFLILAIALVLAGCAGTPQRGSTSGRGGYYLDDGPGDNPPADLASIPNAVPKAEPIKASTSRPYTVFGQTYSPLSQVGSYRERGLASWYGRRFHSQSTSSGEPYDMYAMTAAHKTLPIPSYARVTNLKNGRSVIVRINDRGPFRDGRIIDLSYTAAWKLDILKGVTEVEVASIDPGEALPPPANLARTDSPAPEGIVTASLPPLDPPAARTVSGTTYLQLGAFSSDSAAAQLAHDLQARFGASLPDVHAERVGDLFKVRMGPFPSLAEADQAAQRVEQETGIRAFRTAQ